jgi:hypothetical protein
MPLLLKQKRLLKPLKEKLRALVVTPQQQPLNPWLHAAPETPHLVKAPVSPRFLINLLLKLAG